MELLGADSLTVRASVIRASVKIADVLEKLGRPLDVSGTQQVLCPNPDHPERRPSARYYEESNHIYCFRCGQRWDPVGLVRVHQQTDLAGAIEWIVTHFRIPALADMAPTVIAALTKPRERPDFSQVVAALEQQVRSYRGRMPPAAYHRCWIALDTARESHAQRQIDDEQFESALLQIGAFAEASCDAVPSHR